MKLTIITVNYNNAAGLVEQCIPYLPDLAKL